MNGSPATEPRALHDVQHCKPLLTGIMIFAEFVEILQLQHLVFDEVEGDLAVPVALTDPNADTGCLSIDASHHGDYISQPT